MKITYIGNFKHAWCTETHIAKTLEQLGHTVIRLQEDETGMPEIVQQANESDLLLWTRTYGMMPYDGFEMLKQVRVPTASFHLDYYFGISRQTKMQQDPFWFTDFVFQPDGDHQEEFRSLGVNSFWSPPAVFQDACYLLDRAKTHEVIFVGSFGDYHAEWPWRRELINKLSTAYQSQFELYPQGEAIREEPLNELYSSTKIVVGDSLNLEGNKTYSTDRIFETTGRGGFIIYPKIPFLADIFGDSLVTYERGDWDGLRQKIDYYLEHDDEREALRLKAHNITKNHHTYHQRMRKILRIIKNGKKT